MSWVDGARTEYPANLKITGDLWGKVKILAEPQSRSFGKKKNRKGEEIDDIRYFTQVEYLDGNARGKEGSEDSFPAAPGETYTLWISATLSGAMLEALDWNRGDPAPIMTDTRWKVYRSEETRGGNRLYSAELLSTPPQTSTSKKIPEETPKEPTPSETPVKDIDDAEITALANSLKIIKELDLTTWEQYCQNANIDMEAATKRMVELGLVETDSLKIKFL